MVRKRARSSSAGRSQKKYVVEQISAKKVLRGQTYYFMKWKDFPATSNTWEPKVNLMLECPNLIEEFENNLSTPQQVEPPEDSVPGPSSVKVEVNPGRRENATNKPKGRKVNNKKRRATFKIKGRKSNWKPKVGAKNQSAKPGGSKRTAEALPEQGNLKKRRVRFASKPQMVNIAPEGIFTEEPSGDYNMGETSPSAAATNLTTRKAKTGRGRRAVKVESTQHDDSELAPENMNEDTSVLDVKRGIKRSSVKINKVKGVKGRKKLRSAVETPQGDGDGDGSPPGSDSSDDGEGEEETGFKILAIAEQQNELMFIAKVPGSDRNTKLVPAKEANVRWPREVIKWYEERLVFKTRTKDVFRRYYPESK